MHTGFDTLSTTGHEVHAGAVELFGELALGELREALADFDGVGVSHIALIGGDLELAHLVERNLGNIITAMSYTRQFHRSHSGGRLRGAYRDAQQ